MQNRLNSRVNTAGIGSLTRSLTSMVGQLRSAGYAITTAFTAPLIAAGRRVLSFTNDNLTAFAELQKVYGSNPFGHYGPELDALKKNFEALSNEYGINQAEVIGVGAAWAQAGVSGANLARSVDTTMKAMVIGGLSAAQATDSLIAIQAQYGASSSQLVDILNTLNVVENQTGVSMKGLIDGFQRAAGSAAAAGIDYRHLAAMIAALTPAAGTAAQAGNSLKTIISRLFAPTNDAVDILKKLGIGIADVGWKSATGTQRVERVATAFHKLGSAQQNVVSSTLASRFQINRFNILMNDVYNGITKGAGGLSYYKTALDATKNPIINAMVAQNELNTVMQSQPHQLQQIGVMMKNTFSDILIPLIPTILAFAGMISGWAKAFQNLSPEWQKFIGFTVLGIAVLGPILLYFSAMASAVGVLVTVMRLLSSPLGLVFKLFGMLGGGAKSAIQALVGMGRAAITEAEQQNASALRIIELNEQKALSANEAAVTSMSAYERGGIAAEAEAAAVGRANAVYMGYVAEKADAILAGTEAEAAARQAGVEAFVASIAEADAAMQASVTAAGEAATGVTTAWVAGMFATTDAVMEGGKDLNIIWLAELADMETATNTAGAAILSSWEGSMAGVISETEAASAAADAAFLAGLRAISTETATSGGLIVSEWQVALAKLVEDSATEGASLQAIWTGIYGDIAAETEATAASLSPTWIAGATELLASTEGLGTDLNATWSAMMGGVVAETEAATAAVAADWNLGIGLVLASMEGITPAMEAVWADAMGNITGLTLGAAGTLQEVWDQWAVTMPNVTLKGATSLQTIWDEAMGATVAATEGAALDLDLAWSTAMGALVSETETAMLTEDEVFATGMANAVASMEAAMATGTIIWDAGLSEWVVATEIAMAAIDTEVATGMAVVAGEVEGTVGIIGGIMAGVVAVLTSPWTLAIAAIVAVGIAFRDQIGQVWQGIVEDADKLFHMLPQSVQSAMQEVVDVVESAAKAVYELFSYINPFAHHSPSLVENVDAGMDHIKKSVSTLTDIEGPVKKAYDLLKSFSKAGSTPWSMKVDAGVTHLKKDNATPGQIGEYKALGDEVGNLLPIQQQYAAAIATEQVKVNGLKATLDAANNTYNTQKDILDGLTASQQVYGDQISKLKGDLQDLSQVQITGQQAMSDQIFDNTEAQKKLQLQMMQMEDVTGPIDDVSAKLANLNGEILNLSGTRKSLEQSGAGSEITKTYDDQIKSLQGQQSAIGSTVDSYNALNDQLSQLQHTGQELQLMNDIKFDPLERQIQSLVNGLHEMPFDDIVAGINKDNAALVTAQGHYDDLAAKIANQKTVVNQANVARNAAQKAYDQENAKLKTLKDSYDKVTKAIAALKTAMGSITSSASASHSAAKAKASTEGVAAKNFDAAAGGNFKTQNLGNTLQNGNAGGVKDINAQTQAALDNTRKSFGKLDFLGPIKRAWKHVTDWWSTSVVPGFGNFGDQVGKSFGGHIDLSAAQDKISGFFRSIANSNFIKTLGSMIGVIGRVVGALMKLYMPILREFVKDLIGYFEQWYKSVFPKIAPLLGALGRLFSLLWQAIKPVVEIIGGALLLAFSVLGHMFTATLGPALKTFARLVGDLMQIVTGVINFIVDVLTGKWGKAFDDMKNITKGALNFIGHLFGGLWDIVVGALKGFGTGIIDFFKTVFGVDIWNGARHGLEAGWKWLTGIISKVFNAVIDFVKGIFGIHSPSKVFADIGMDLIRGLVSGLVFMAKTLWDWFVVMPLTILAKLGDLTITLVQSGIDLLGGLISGIWNGAKAIWDWFTGFAGSALLKLGALEMTLFQKGKDLLGGLWGGVKAVWKTVASWIGGRAKAAVSAIGNLGSTLLQAGKDLFWGIYHGVTGIWSDHILPWFHDLPTRLKNIFLKAAGWLVDAGGSIASGLYKGIQEGLKDLAKVFGTPVYWAVKYAIDPIITGLNYLPGVHLNSISTKGIPHFAKGGIVPGSHNRDDVAAYLTPGELVVPKPIVNKHGGPEKLMDTLGFQGRALSGHGHHFGWGGWITDIPGDVGSAITGAASAIAGVAKDAWGDLKSAGGAIVKAGSGTISALDGAIQGGFKEFKKDVIDPTTHLLRKGAASAFMSAVGNPVKKADNFLDRKKFDPLGHSFNVEIDTAVDGIYNWIKGGESLSQKKANEIITKSGNVKNHAAFEIQALELAGHKPTADLMSALGLIISYESGWNPNAINLTDSNAKAGHPSQGLMQTIPSTFEAYRLHSLPDVITNPLANAVAGIRYADSRYGGLNAVPGVEAVRHGGSYVGYDLGGLVPPGISSVINATGAPEVVAPQKTFSQIFSRLDALEGGKTIDNSSVHSETTSITFTGDLTFPNIENGDDAEEFIANIKSLATGAI